MAEGLSFNYYRILVSVIELIYIKVDSNSVWYKNEPFILTTMAKQVFYLDDSAMGYLPITPSELNSLQRNPNHDDDGFIDDEIEEDDDSDDSDYHEYD
ncbi:hypothetical protein ACLB2K_012948 [Fragaria x ananassa]